MNIDHLNFVVEARYYGYWIALVFAIICLLMFVYLKIDDIRKSKKAIKFEKSRIDIKKEICKQKKKRCLANAEMAKQISMRYYFMFCLDSHDGIVSGCTSYRSVRKRDFWDKWEIKWLKLADKFKE
ncbi:MAG: hypothetical protein IKE41_03625 [Clostridia bacterium]|nr:hypothetical protein [Clostridia bacterium]